MTKGGFDPDEGYKMSMSEFKGATLNALQELKEDVKELKSGQNSVQLQLNNQKLLTTVISAVTSIFVAIINPFKIK